MKQSSYAQRNVTFEPNPHYAGHHAGFHPEDNPYDQIEEDDSYYVTKKPTSARRYQTADGSQVIQQGNRRLVIHNEPPSKKRQMHWSLFLGLGMILALLLWLGASEALAWWNSHQLDSQYGMPRTYQTDQIVYQSDSLDHPSHYIFLNLTGTVMIVEIPHGDPTHARMYKGPTIYSDSAGYTPVTGEFKEVNGKMEMIVHVGDQQFIYINDGTQFKPQQ